MSNQGNGTACPEWSMSKIVHMNEHELVVVVAVGICCLGCGNESVVTDAALTVEQLEEITRIVCDPKYVSKDVRNAKA